MQRSAFVSFANHFVWFHCGRLLCYKAIVLSIDIRSNFDGFSNPLRLHVIIVFKDKPIADY